MTTGKTIALTRQTFVGKVMSLLFNMLSAAAAKSLQSCLEAVKYKAFSTRHRGWVSFLFAPLSLKGGFPSSSVIKDPSANAGDARIVGQSLVQEDLLEKEMAIHSSILAWKIP